MVSSKIMTNILLKLRNVPTQPGVPYCCFGNAGFTYGCITPVDSRNLSNVMPHSVPKLAEAFMSLWRADVCSPKRNGGTIMFSAVLITHLVLVKSTNKKEYFPEWSTAWGSKHFA